MYAITATVTRKDHEGWTSTRQIPTFFLDEYVQGIGSLEGVKAVAADIINPLHLDIDVIVCAVEVNPTAMTAEREMIEAAKRNHPSSRAERPAFVGLRLVT